MESSVSIEVAANTKLDGDRFIPTGVSNEIEVLKWITKQFGVC